MAAPSEQSRERTGVTGLALPAGLLIGIGAGMFVGNIAAGTLVGQHAAF